MDLRLLRSFIAVADDQNICRAANKLHLTQSALSRRIKALESELGVTLLCRRAHSFSLTHADCKRCETEVLPGNINMSPMPTNFSAPG